MRSMDLSVYLVTDAGLCGTRGVMATVKAAVEGGVTVVQIRNPHAPARQLVEEARALITWLRPRGVPLIVNDRVDVALVSGADGVHLGQTDLAPADARRILGADAIVGLSVGTLSELAVSSLDGVDYLGVGPVFGTATKADAGAAIGPEGVAAIRARVSQAIVAIGGLNAANAAEAIRAGAQGVAVVSALCAAPDPAHAARAIADAVRRAAASPQAGR